MKYLPSLVYTLTFTSLALLVGPQCGFAASLQKGNLNSAGDGLLTIDPNIGLEFLAPRATSGLSYNQALATPFVTQQGFHFASAAQVQTLYMDAGITDFSGSFNTADYAPLKNLVDNFIGSTIPSEINLPIPAFAATIAAGDYTLTTAVGSITPVIGVDYQTAAESSTGQPDARVILNFAALPLNQPGPTVPTTDGGSSKPLGSFLVRPETATTATPEPAGTGLLGLSIIGVLAFARKFRRKLAA